MYLCLPARLVTLAALRVLAELTGPEVSVEVGGTIFPGGPPRGGLLEVGGVLLLIKAGPEIDVLVELWSLLWYVLGPLNNPLGNPGFKAGCSELERVLGPNWVGEGLETSVLSIRPNLEAGSVKMGYSKSIIPRSQEGMSGGGIDVMVDAVGDDPGTWASSLNLLATSILVLLASNSCSSLLLRPGSLCPRVSV